MKNISIFILTSMILSLIILILSTIYSEMKPEKTFIPEGFTGKVKVFFDVPDGEEMSFSDGYRILRIPESGILKTQFRPNLGIESSDNPKKQFYYFSESDTIRLRTIYSCIDITYEDSLNLNDIVVSGFGVGVYGGSNKNVLEFYRVDSLRKVFNGCIR